jgi:nitroimidazol reductase NimA-like FMN-containing flavoprotein (pyridoxamine 5'-phosphate oxidase superfamily)
VSDEVTADRPYMPGYGIAGAGEGTGLLPWSWAEERLTRSHDFWLATTSPEGEPHLMPVWAMWLAGALWFSSSNGSRKTRNLRANGRCSLSTDTAAQPVVVKGIAEVVTDQVQLQAMLDAENAKYGSDYSIDTLDPAVNTCFRVRPVRVFGLDTEDFTGSPTRWTP